MPAMADILLFRTTGSSDPPLLHAGELAVTAAPANVGKMWIGDGAANRLLLSTSPADLPLATANYLPLQGGTLTGAITLPTGYSPTDNLHVATKGYVDTRDALYLPLTGGTLNGNLTMGAGRTLTLAGNATANAHAVPLQQVNSLLSGYLPSTGGDLSGPLTISSGLVLLDGAANFLIGGSMVAPRWMLQLGDGTPETGGDVGNNFVLQAWSDAGGVVPVFDIARTRRWLSSYPLTLRAGAGAGADSNIYGASSGGLVKWSIALGTDPADADGNFYIGRYDDAGAKISNALTINRQTGTAYFTGPVGVNYTPLANSVAGQIFANNNFVLPRTGGLTFNWSAPTTYMVTGDACRISFASASIIFSYAASGPAGTEITAQTTPFQMRLNSGDLIITGNFRGQNGYFDGPVTLPASDPIAATHAASKGYVDGLREVGITFSFIGGPPPGGRIVVPITSNILLPANLAGTVAACGNKPATNSSYILERTTLAGVTTAIATIVLSAATGGVVPGTSTAVSLVAGEALSLVAPAIVDATAADVGITVAGVRV